MKKNITKKKFIGQEFGMFFILIAILICAAVFFFHKLSPSFSTMGSFARIKNWIVEKKDHIKNINPKSVTKPITMNKEDEELPIHFEFYTSLPNMRVAVPESVVVENNSQARLPEKEISKAAKPKIARTKTMIVSEDELINDFANHIKQKSN